MNYDVLQIICYYYDLSNIKQKMKSVCKEYNEKITYTPFYFVEFVYDGNVVALLGRKYSVHNNFIKFDWKTTAHIEF